MGAFSVTSQQKMGPKSVHKGVGLGPELRRFHIIPTFQVFSADNCDGPTLDYKANIEGTPNEIADCQQPRKGERQKEKKDTQKD